MSEIRRATEQMPFEKALEKLPEAERLANTFLARIEAKRPLGPRAKIVDVGSGPGLYLLAFAKEAYTAVGIEPWKPARELTHRLAEHQHVSVDVYEGTAERIPLPAETCDLVFCNNVIEHVGDPMAAFNEACRILKPGGLYWWASASSLSPRQGEIRGFPCFGWYPNSLKVRIMHWAKENKPHLVGYTETPALHWWTPWKARRMLHAVGFAHVFDRWDIRLPSEGGRLHAAALRIMQLSGLARFLADVLFEGCAFLAIKPPPDAR